MTNNHVYGCFCGAVAGGEPSPPHTQPPLNPIPPLHQPLLLRWEAPHAREPRHRWREPPLRPQ